MNTSLVDAHVHLWNPRRFRYAWLDAWPALNRAFLPADFTEASATADVNKLIFVESGCDPAQSLAEVDWISDLAKAEPRLQGVVAHAPLEKGEAVRPDLEKLAHRSLVKGVRRNLQGEPDLAFCLRPELIAGIRLLADFGFSFDLCLRHEQLRHVAELTRRVPQVTFVVDHLGKPDVRGKQTGPWAADLQVLATRPNVVCKISGLVTEADWHRWHPDDLKFYFGRALECFGFDRVLFGGDWPVVTVAAGYERWLETVRSFLSGVSEVDQIKFFQTNAERIYRV